MKLRKILNAESLARLEPTISESLSCHCTPVLSLHADNVVYLKLSFRKTDTLNIFEIFFFFFFQTILYSVTLYFLICQYSLKDYITTGSKLSKLHQDARTTILYMYFYALQEERKKS